MENTLGGSGVPSGGSTTGPMSAVTKDDKVAVSSEVSSSYPDEDDLELGLGLCVGGGNLRSRGAAVPTPYARILTAKDLPSSISMANKSTPFFAGTKRTATDSVSPPKSPSQLVGWPPIRAYRMNSLVSQAKSPMEDLSSMVDENRTKNILVDSNSGSGCNKYGGNDSKDNGIVKNSLFVKVNMDGTLIGRKVDLTAHGCYESLAQTLEDMFFGPSMSMSARRSTTEDHEKITKVAGPSKLLDGSSEFVLTYEDKEGDWMLVGDVPWRMFLNSVKRLRIMRTSEANGLAPGFQERNGRQRTKAA